MTNREIIDCIDRGANYYVSLFGRAEHMEIVQREHYSLVRPKGDVFGIRFVYDVRLEGLPLQRQKELAAEIHALGMPVWLNLGTSPEAFQAFTGREKQDVPQDSDGESYLAMLPGEMPAYPAFPQVTEAKTQPEFARWAETVNQVLSGGKEDIHPQYHYPLCRDGLMRCYMVQDREGRALSAAAAAVDGECVSLEFVATLPEFRRQGLARALCCRAVEDAFRQGAEIVTVRAIDGRAAALYEAVGFQQY